MAWYCKLFHWKYSSVFGAAFWFSGITMSGSTYNAALFFLLLGGTWLSGWWIVGHPGPRKRDGQKQWKKGQIKQLRNRRLGALFFIGITVLPCWWTVSLKKEHRLGLAEDDLLPAGEASPVNLQCIPPNNAFKVFFGSSLAYFTGQSPFTFITVNDDPKFLIETMGSRLSITTDILAEDGRTVLVRIVKNHFILTTGGEILQRTRPVRSTLIVVDKNGHTALNIHYINETTVKIMGDFHYPGVHMTITEDEARFDGNARFTSRGGCTANAGVQLGPRGVIVH
jgi:hypothetical protein